MKGKSSAAKRPSKAGYLKVREHRARLRALGLRPIQLWVPDVSTPEFAEEARRQSRLVATSPGAADDQAFVDAISAFTEE